MQFRSLFGFDIGDQLQLKYKAAQPDKGFKKFVGLNFKSVTVSVGYRFIGFAKKTIKTDPIYRFYEIKR